MATNKLRFLIAASMSLALMSSGASAQIIYGQKASGAVSFTYTHWSLENAAGKATISQLSFPVAGFLPLAENTDAQFYIGGASNSLTSGTTDYSLGGLEDIRLQVNRSFSEDHLVASLGVNVPVGKKELNLTEEWQLLQVLSRDYVNFPVRRLGEGLGVNALVGGATMLGEFRVGAGVGYSFLGSYSPYEGIEDYNPGDVLTANVGLDTERGAMRWAARILETVYSTDKYKDQKSFKQGAVTQFILSGNHTGERMTLGAQLSYVLRGRNQRYAYPAETLVDQLKLFGNEFSADVDCGIAAGPLWTVAPFVSGRFIQANEEGLDNARIYGIGSGVVRHVGQGQIEARLGWYTGNADGGDVDLTGLQLSGGARITF